MGNRSRVPTEGHLNGLLSRLCYMSLHPIPSRFHGPTAARAGVLPEPPMRMDSSFPRGGVLGQATCTRESRTVEAAADVPGDSKDCHIVMRCNSAPNIVSPLSAPLLGQIYIQRNINRERPEL